VLFGYFWKLEWYLPLSKDSLLNAVEEMKKNSPKRKFKQAVELVMRLKEIDLKKQDSRIAETVQLPNPVGKVIKVCFIAAGDLAVRAKSAGADLILGRNDLERLGREKKEARKIAREYDHFLSEAPLMPLVGKTLGATLGPRGKMPVTVPPSATVEDVLARQRGTIRIRVRDQPVVQCRVGMEDMPSEKIAQNVETVVNAIEAKLERGMGNIGSVLIKTTMGAPVKVPLSKG
jgi:large subunit ribosomal protein L1